VDLVSDVNPWHAAFTTGHRVPITDVDIQMYIDKVSNATFKTTMPLDIWQNNAKAEVYAKIFYKNTEVYNGYCRQHEYAGDGTASIRLEDISYVLWETNCQTNADVFGLFQPEIRIDGREPWSGAKRTIGYYINKIINDFNQSGIAINFVDLSPGQELSNRTSVIGQSSSDTSGLPTLVLTHMSIAMALKRIIMDWCGQNMWYDLKITREGKKCGILYAGSKRNTIPGATIPLFHDMKKTSAQNQVPATKVFVRCNNGNQYITGSAGADPSRCVTYEINGAFSKVELDAIANRVLQERSEGSISYEVSWQNASNVYITPRPADVFDKIGDLTQQDVNPDEIMQWDTYSIQEVQISSTGTTCILGGIKQSIFDIYKSTLSRVDGGNNVSEEKDVSASYGVIEVEGSTSSQEFKGWKSIYQAAESRDPLSDPTAPASCGNGGGKFLIDDKLKLPASTDDLVYMTVFIGSPRCDDPSLEKFGDAYTDPYNPDFYTGGKASPRALHINLYKGEKTEK